MEREQQRRTRRGRERTSGGRRGRSSSPSSLDSDAGGYIPREEDFLDRGADEMDSFAGSSIDDIFTYTGGMQSGPSRNSNQLTVQQVRARRSLQRSRQDPAWSDTLTEDSDSDGGKGSGDVPTCSICLDRVKKVSTRRVLTCAHVFHASCIAEWLQRSNRCPLCRTEQ